jgi:site-specific recombinase XerD
VGYLTEFFGPDKPLRNIRPGDADEWRLFLIGKRLADNTVRRRCGAAKQFFRAAVRKGLVAANPFADLKAVVQGNPSGNTPSAARRRRRCWMPARMPSGG